MWGGEPSHHEGGGGGRLLPFFFAGKIVRGIWNLERWSGAVLASFQVDELEADSP